MPRGWSGGLRACNTQESPKTAPAAPHRRPPGAPWRPVLPCQGTGGTARDTAPTRRYKHHPSPKSAQHSPSPAPNLWAAPTPLRHPSSTARSALDSRRARPYTARGPQVNAERVPQLEGQSNAIKAARDSRLEAARKAHRRLCHCARAPLATQIYEEARRRVTPRQQARPQKSSPHQLQLTLNQDTST